MGRDQPTTERAEVATLMRSLLHEICDIPIDAILDDASIDEELQIDSSQLAQIQVELENHMDISIDFLEILRLQRFDRICDYIYGLLART